MAINKVILLGNIGRDIEIKRWENGGVSAVTSLATSEKAYKMKNGTEVPERTEWHNLVFSNRIAEVAEKYLEKGAKIYIEGRLRTRSYDAKDGKRYITEIYVEKLEMLGGRDRTQQAQQPASNPYAQQPQQAVTNPYAQHQEQIKKQENPYAQKDAEAESDLPF